MIVRIMGEGQLELDDSQLDELNKLDAEVESAVETGDERAFSSTLGALLETVRRLGNPLSEDSLQDSDLILPHSDATIDEVRHLLEGDGLIPG